MSHDDHEDMEFLLDEVLKGSELLIKFVIAMKQLHREERHDVRHRPFWGLCRQSVRGSARAPLTLVAPRPLGREAETYPSELISVSVTIRHGGPSLRTGRVA